MKGRFRDAMLRRIWKIPLFALVLIVLLSISLAAAIIVYTLRVPSSIVIPQYPEGTYQIKLYWDNETTIEVQSIYFGEVKPGQYGPTVTFYIKNLSTLPVDVEIGTRPYPWIDFSGSVQQGIQPNEVRKMTLRAYAGYTATSGTYDFELIVNVYPG